MTRGEQRVARGLTAGGRPYRMSATPRPTHWPPMAQIESWATSTSDMISRSVSAGQTSFRVRQSGGSWLAHEVVITDDGRALGWIRFVGSFPSRIAAMRACERLANAEAA